MMSSLMTAGGLSVITDNDQSLSYVELLNNQKAYNKIFVCKFSNNIESKLYHIENSKTREQAV